MLLPTPWCSSRYEVPPLSPRRASLQETNDVPANDGHDAVPAMSGTLPSSEARPALSGEEKDVLLACLDVLLREDSSDVAMAEVLRLVGRHYKADRVYTLTLADDGRTVRASHEWMEDGRCSLKRQVTGMTLDRLPLLWRWPA